jgi:hypothetical protein
MQLLTLPSSGGVFGPLNDAFGNPVSGQILVTGPTAGYTLTGFFGPQITSTPTYGSPLNGAEVSLVLVAAQQCTLAHLNAAANPNFQIVCPTGENIVLPSPSPGGFWVVRLLYSSDANPFPPSSQGGWLVMSVAAASPFARGWADNTSNVFPGSTTSTIVASVTVTAGTTGKFRVTATGTFVNVSAASGVLVACNLSHGSGVTTSDYNGPAAYLGANGAVGSLIPFAISVDYDKSATVGPIIFPIGTAVQFNFVITLGSATANVGISAHACQLEAQEVP